MLVLDIVFNLTISNLTISNLTICNLTRSVIMKKGTARLGIIGFVSLFTFPCIAFPCFAMSVSDLLISEVMANPAAISDARGEWLELYNPTIEPINLRGIDLGDDGSNRHRFDTDLLILPGEFLTLARSHEPGFVPDYVYDDFTLANSSDEVIFRDGLFELLRLDYGSGFAVAGVSRELEQLPMMASNYGLTMASLGYGAGDIGTPGAAGTASGMFFASSAAPSAAPSAVPVPAAAWLFISGLLAIFSPTAIRKARGISASPILKVAARGGVSKCPGPPSQMFASESLSS
jgi:hypothetical protein